jgi:hypothetical protein
MVRIFHGTKADANGNWVEIWTDEPDATPVRTQNNKKKPREKLKKASQKAARKKQRGK